MSMKIVRLSSLLFAFVLAASAFCFDLPALAGNAPGQNTNSSTTAAENSNTGAAKRGRSRRRGRRVAAAVAEPAETPAAVESQATAVSATEQTDLSTRRFTFT